MRAAFAFLALVAAAVCAPCPLHAQPQDGEAGQEGQPLRYAVTFSGVTDKALLDLLASVSSASAMADKPVANAFLLRGRARGDLEKIRKALASRGYFAARADVNVDEAARPARVAFTVDTGPPFILKWVDVELTPDSAPVGFPLPEAAALGLDVQGPGVSKDIVDAEGKLTAYFRNKGHPFAAVTKRKAVADFAEHTLHVTYVVAPGPYAVFGRTEFKGLKDVREDLLTPLTPWKEGDTYRQDQVELFERRLADLGLFAKASVQPRKALESPDKAVIEASLTERKQRTFKGGLTYNTDDGPGARVSWEHRNLFGRGERLRLHAAVSPASKVLEANFENPFFLDQKQRLLAGARVADEDTTAFHGQNATVEAKISRKLGEHVSAEAGAGYRASLIYDDAANPGTSNTRYNLAFIPLGLSLDTRDDPLDPSKGVQFAARAAPYLDAGGSGINFFKGSLAGSFYLSLIDSPRVVLATRASAGSVTGVCASKLLPPDVRFYAGGSGSVRGYAYQTVGPLRGSKPLGGRSLFDFGTELRVRVSEMFGVVAFLDGGNAYETEYPDPGKGVLAGAGLGLRVFTPIGPFRVDVATPLYRRAKVDDYFQLYLSIGQAF